MFLARACELAARGVGSTAPNPAVGAVIVRDGRTLGEGFHHVRGDAHAEVEALRDAAVRGHDVRGATMFVTLEPCNHHGRTPPCSDAVVDAGIVRVIAGTADPNPKTAGAGFERLRGAGIVVENVEDPIARAIVEPFALAVRTTRPYVTLKMAASLDGYVAPRAGSYWLTSPPSRERVRELRAAHDAVMVGAGTIRADDARLTVRPPRARRRPYVRIVACRDRAVSPDARVFEPLENTETVVLAPGDARERMKPLESVAECLYIGDAESSELDLAAALAALKSRGIESVLCEGGPTLAASLLAEGLVDRLVWFVAPVLLGSDLAIPVLAKYVTLGGWKFETVERSGEDVMLTAKLNPDV